MRLRVPADPAQRATQVFAVLWTLIQFLLLPKMIVRYQASRAFSMDVLPGFVGPFATDGLDVVALGLLAVIGCWTVISPTRVSQRMYAVSTLLCGAFLLLHIDGFGWAVSVQLFWCGLWLCWLQFSGVHSPDMALQRGPLFCLWVVGTLFLAPFLWKHTPAWWQGEAFWYLHFQSEFGMHRFLGPLLGEDLHRLAATYYSRLAIVSEGVLCLVWLLPARLGFGFVLLTVGTILMLTPEFYDAMGCLAALALSGWSLADHPDAQPAQ